MGPGEELAMSHSDETDHNPVESSEDVTSMSVAGVEISLTELIKTGYLPRDVENRIIQAVLALDNDKLKQEEAIRDLKAILTNLKFRESVDDDVASQMATGAGIVTAVSTASMAGVATAAAVGASIAVTAFSGGALLGLVAIGFVWSKRTNALESKRDHTRAIGTVEALLESVKEQRRT